MKNNLDFGGPGTALAKARKIQQDSSIERHLI
jgi:hypothetical protein